MLGITRNQWIAIALLVLSVNMGATSQFTDLFGAGVAKTIVSISSLGSSILAGIQIILGGQSQQVQDVRAMPGVEKIEVNEQANKALATLAVSPDDNKVTIKPGDAQAVAATAKAA